MFDLCVLGLGYIGLPTSSMFAARGKKVIGVDIRHDIVEKLNNGEIHIEEPDLDVMVRAAVQSGNLVADIVPSEAEVFIIAVPTPFKEGIVDEIPSPDLSAVEAACRSLSAVVPEGALIILESTSPVGTTIKVKQWVEDELKNLGRGIDKESLDYVHCPERILPGQMLAELVSNDRIVGGLTGRASERAEELYRAFCSGAIIRTDAGIAEMVKLTENASRDVQIAFANELSIICGEKNLNVWEVIRLANHHPRVNILNPGAGVGGHCIAVDPWFLIDSCREHSQLMRTARSVNDAKTAHVIRIVKEHVERFKSPKIGCLGLAFKPNVDDLRNSPAMEIATAILGLNCKQFFVAEPNITELPADLVNYELVLPETLVRQSDIIVCLVNHREFQVIDRMSVNDKVLIDPCGMFKA